MKLNYVLLLSIFGITTYAFSQNTSLPVMGLNAVSATAPTVTVIDNSSYSIPVTKIINISQDEARIQELQDRDNVWTQRINQDQGEINTLQTEIDQGAENGVANAVPYASATAQTAIAAQNNTQNASQGAVAQ